MTNDTEFYERVVRRIGWMILALGFAGGMVPTPSAVIVLLGATAIGRAWFGVTLVVFDIVQSVWGKTTRSLPPPDTPPSS